MSLPVVVIVNVSQECNARATVLWDNAFSDKVFQHARRRLLIHRLFLLTLIHQPNQQSLHAFQFHVVFDWGKQSFNLPPAILSCNFLPTKACCRHQSTNATNCIYLVRLAGSVVCAPNLAELNVSDNHSRNGLFFWKWHPRYWELILGIAVVVISILVF